MSATESRRLVKRFATLTTFFSLHVSKDTVIYNKIWAFIKDFPTFIILILVLWKLYSLMFIRIWPLIDIFPRFILLESFVSFINNMVIMENTVLTKALLSSQHMKTCSKLSTLWLSSPQWCLDKDSPVLIKFRECATKKDYVSAGE